MAKRLKHSDLSEQEIKRASDVALAHIAEISRDIKGLEDEAEIAVQKVMAQYATTIAPLKAMLAKNVAWLKDTMKSNRAVLFSVSDVVDLVHGSLIRNVDDKVTIPRDALERCRAQGFTDVIKIAESLDREAVEKWPDERLFLIGAARKPKEEFSYDLKEHTA